MKFRILFLLALAVTGILSMSSCVKSYTCHCVISYSGTPGLPDTVIKEYTVKDTKSGAKSKCSSESGTYNNNGIMTDEHCYIY